jgi:hypothetical protein
MEDLALSLRVGKQWRLANVRTARIFHDSQPGAHKSDIAALAEMELVNRHFVMTQVLGKSRARDYGHLILWEAFQLLSGSQGDARLRGKARALKHLCAARSS